jgi:hypothetical protein
MTGGQPIPTLVLRILALILIVVGAVIVLVAGWARGLSPIVVGLALLVVDEAMRRRRDGKTARS